MSGVRTKSVKDVYQATYALYLIMFNLPILGPVLDYEMNEWDLDEGDSDVEEEEVAG